MTASNGTVHYLLASYGEVTEQQCADCREVTQSGQTIAGTCNDSQVPSGCWGNRWCEAYDSRDDGDFCLTRCTPCDAGPEGDECTSPIVIDFGSNGFRFTDLQHGVAFDLNADGVRETLSWIDPNAQDAFLVLDRNGNGTIDDGTELFGDATLQPAAAERNGYLALAVFDGAASGGNEDGVISAADAIWSSLRLWFDSSHDGISQSEELRTLDAHGVVSLELEYRESNRRDRFGNSFRYASQVGLADRRKTQSVDVYLLK